MGRANQFAVTFTAAGRDMGLWSAMEGVSLSGEPTLHYQGAMRPPVSLGAEVEAGAVTLSKLEADLTDADIAHLIDVAGSTQECVAARQRLDARNQVTRRPLMQRGTISGLNFADVDATSNDPAMVQVVLAVTGKPTLA